MKIMLNVVRSCYLLLNEDMPRNFFLAGPGPQSEQLRPKTKCLFLDALPSPQVRPLLILTLVPWWGLIFPQDRYAATPSLPSITLPAQTHLDQDLMSLFTLGSEALFLVFCLHSVAVSFHPLPLSFPWKGQPEIGVWESISKTFLLLFFPDRCQKLASGMPSAPFQDYLGSFLKFPTLVILNAAESHLVNGHNLMTSVCG